MENNVPTSADRRETKAAADLKPGDRIPAGFLPNGKAAEVLYVTTFPLPSTGQLWAMVAYRLTDSFADAEHYPADGQIPVEPSDPTGLNFSREADDPTPVSPARVVQELAYIAPTADGGVVFALRTKPQCSPECRAQLAANGLDHLISCPVAHAEAQEPVHHFAQGGVTACDKAVGELPKVDGYGQAHDAINCPACLAEMVF